MTNFRANFVRENSKNFSRKTLEIFIIAVILYGIVEKLHTLERRIWGTKSCIIFPL